MIFVKWYSSWATPPSLLVMLINMFLSFGSTPAPADVLYGNKVRNHYIYLSL